MLDRDFDFQDVFRKHSLFLTSSEDLSGGEDEAIRSGGQTGDGANGEVRESPGAGETVQGNSTATEDNSGEVGAEEALANSSDAETGNEETKGQ